MDNVSIKCAEVLDRTEWWWSTGTATYLVGKLLFFPARVTSHKLLVDLVIVVWYCHAGLPPLAASYLLDVVSYGIKCVLFIHSLGSISKVMFSVSSINTYMYSVNNAFF